MGKIVSLIITTLDGFTDGKYGNIDPEFYEFSHVLMANAETIAFGRNTFEVFQSRWPLVLEMEDAPTWQVKMAKALNDQHKAVYSSTLKSTTWNNSTIVQRADVEHIKLYKQKGRGGLLTLGSLNLVASLARMNMIDDYYFCIQPRLGGNGDERLFDKIRLDTPRDLTYVDHQQLKSGVQIMHYQNIQ